jgi:tRNA_anti-like
MKKNILISLLVVAVGGAAIGFYLWNKPHQDMASAKADMSLSAKVIYDEFGADENAANAKYLDKVVQVKGLVASIDKQEGTTVITLDTGDPMGGVACELDPLSKHERTDFQAGEEVIFKGTCSGKLSDVQLSRCVLVK